MKHIYKCSECDFYTMKLDCPKCSKKTVLARPLKYSPEDRLAVYRREFKKYDLIKRDLL